jgi:DNA-binding response OmpR family regulator
MLDREGARWDATRADGGAPACMMSSESILVVSDDEQRRVSVCELLAALGYAHVRGIDSNAALSSEQVADCDVAIVDASARHANAVRGMLHGKPADAAQRHESLVVGPITLHTLRNVATVANREIDLTGAETRILAELLARASSPVSRDRLTLRALGRQWSPFDRSLDTHVKRLRRKIGEDHAGRTPIRTIRGVGYLLLAEWRPAG